MEKSFDTINLEYIETRKVSVLGKLVAMVLVVIFTFVPMYEFITQFKPGFIGCTYGIAGNCGCIVPLIIN